MIGSLGLPLHTIETIFCATEALQQRQRADPTEPKNDVRAIPPDRREDMTHGFKNLIHLVFLTECRLRVFDRNIRRTGNDLAIEGTKMQMRPSSLEK